MPKHNDFIKVHKIRSIISWNRNLKKAQLYLRRRTSEKKVMKCMDQLLLYPIISVQKLDSTDITLQEETSYVHSKHSDMNHSLPQLEEETSENRSDFFYVNVEDSTNEQEHELNDKFNEIVHHENEDNQNSIESKNEQECEIKDKSDAIILYENTDNQHCIGSENEQEHELNDESNEIIHHENENNQNSMESKNEHEPKIKDKSDTSILYEIKDNQMSIESKNKLEHEIKNKSNNEIVLYENKDDENSIESKNKHDCEMEDKSGKVELYENNNDKNSIKSRNEKNCEMVDKSSGIVLYEDKRSMESNKRKRHGHLRTCSLCASSPGMCGAYSTYLKFSKSSKDSTYKVCFGGNPSKVKYKKNGSNDLCESLEKFKYKENKSIKSKKSNLKKAQKIERKKFNGKNKNDSFKKQKKISVNLKKLTRKTYVMELEEKIKKLQEELGSIAKDKSSKELRDQDISDVAVTPDYQIFNDLDVDTLIHHDDNELMELLADCYGPVEGTSHNYTSVRSPDSGIVNTSTSDTEDMKTVENQLSQTAAVSSPNTSITQFDADNNMETSLLTPNHDTSDVQNLSDVSNNPSLLLSTSSTESMPSMPSSANFLNSPMTPVPPPILNAADSTVSEPVLNTGLVPSWSTESGIPTLTSRLMEPASFPISVPAESQFPQPTLMYNAIATDSISPMITPSSNFVPMSTMEQFPSIVSRLDSFNFIYSAPPTVDRLYPVSPINSFVFLPPNVLFFSSILTHLE